MCPAIQIGEWQISVFPLVLVIAFFLCIIAYMINLKYDFFRIMEFLRCIPMGVIFALIGGKLLSAVTLIGRSGQGFWENVLFGGFVFYGGMIGGFFGVSIYCVCRKVSILDCVDVITSLLPLGQAIGRLGCYFNGCCYGRPYQGLFAVQYPVEGKWVSVFPTWFTESFFCIILFIIMYFLCKTQRRGVHTAIYLITYSAFRFGIEFARGDLIRGVWMGISTSQIISLMTIMGGIVVAIYAACKKDNNLFLKNDE